MNNTINYNVSFGQKVPTASLLKIGGEIFSYPEAKSFCEIFDKKFPGHIGYHKKSQNFVKNIADKNPQLKEIISNISKCADKKEKLSKIATYTKQLGEEIDVII